MVEFYEHPKMVDGHRNQCKACVKSRSAAYRLANADSLRWIDRKRDATTKRTAARAISNKRRTTIQRQLDNFRWAGGDVATVTEKPEFCECCSGSPGKKGLCLDHDHATLAFRGWLCQWCNIGIGHFKDSPVRLGQAIKYLEERK
jgi:hypothetical protein